MLESALQNIIKQRHTKLLDEGKLPSRTQLSGYYETFRKKFGPQVLSDLDGRALLEFMHDHGNRDGLAYWLEFKNDDELPAIFGSISGGSALKFIVFRRAETGDWTTRDKSNYPVAISEERAIEIARSNRDQLVNGAQLLADFPDNATQSDYENLQASMDTVATDVSRLGWGHKYFSLLYPDKLDNYHSPHYQRFHLIRLLQTPPDGDTRYVPAWWFVQIGNELEIPLNHLSIILNTLHDRPYQYWRIGTTDGGTNEDWWPKMRAGNFVAVGWPLLGDLSDIEDGQDVEAHIRELMSQHYPKAANVITRQAGEIRRFGNIANAKHYITEDDIVVASNGLMVRGLGRVVGPYEYVEGSTFPHRRPVEWLSLDDWKIPEQEGLRTIVYQLKRHPSNLIEIERKLLSAKPIEHGSLEQPTKRPMSGLEPLAEQIRGILDRKGQVILYGPPGTGKTFWAQRAAYELAARKSLNISLMGLARDELSKTQGELKQFVQMCTFHPSYGYEDFLEGYRPELSSDQMIFERRNGIFKALCERAANDGDNDYYLIIDEINRGDIPRIFGELLTIMEKNKRGQIITLPLSGETFSAPPNVFLIGTMNTADRSIALLDTALRRRFGFIEFMPDTSLLAGAVAENIPLDLWLDALNTRIIEFVGRDARNLQIGHAYLMDSRGRSVSDFTQFKRILREDIIPLLEEYCYEDYTALKNILGEGLVDETSQRIKYDMFDSPQQDALVSALLQLTPEIIATGKALAADPQEETDILDDEETGDENDE